MESLRTRDLAHPRTAVCKDFDSITCIFGSECVGSQDSSNVSEEQISGFWKRVETCIKANLHKAPRTLTHLCMALQSMSRLVDSKHHTLVVCLSMGSTYGRISKETSPSCNPSTSQLRPHRWCCCRCGAILYLKSTISKLRNYLPSATIMVFRLQ